MASWNAASAMRKPGWPSSCNRSTAGIARSPGAAQATAEAPDDRIQRLRRPLPRCGSYVDEKIAEQIGTLRAQMVRLNQEFAGAVAVMSFGTRQS
jgi:hypothetical protein